MNTEHLKFSDDIKKHWVVKRDKSFDEYIALNGKKALGKGGLDHIYLISEKQAGLWLTCQIMRKITTLQSKVPSLTIIQQGDGEAILSVPIEDLHKLCQAVSARKRKELTEKQRQRLKERITTLRRKKSLVKPALNGPGSEELQTSDELGS